MREDIKPEKMDMAWQMALAAYERHGKSDKTYLELFGELLEQSYRIVSGVFDEV